MIKIKTHSLEILKIILLSFNICIFCSTAVFAQVSILDRTASQKQKIRYGFIEDPSSYLLVNKVSDLRDIQKNDWAHEVLNNLNKNYGCLIGSKYQLWLENISISRFEFAQILAQCLGGLQKLTDSSNQIENSDLDKIKLLVSEFNKEFVGLNSRVDFLNQKVAYLEEHRFSTTTQLNGNVIFAQAQAFGGNLNNSTVASWKNPSNGKPGSFAGNMVFTERTSLKFLSSFNGKDQLFVEIRGGTGGGSSSFKVATGDGAARLAYETNTNNAIEIGRLTYSFQVKNLTFFVGFKAFNTSTILDTYSPYLSGLYNGSISVSQRFNSIVYRDSSSGAGFAIKYKFSSQFFVTALYLVRASQTQNVDGTTTITDFSYISGTQLDFYANPNFKMGFTFLHSYDAADNGNHVPNLFAVGSPIGNNPFNGASTSLNRLGIETSWQITKKINLSAWGGTAFAEGHGFVPNTKYSVEGLSAQIWAWNASFNFLDIGQEGSILSFSGGLLPSAFAVDSISGYKYPINGGAQDRNASYVAQIQYVLPINENISLTPGFYIIFNPNNYAANNLIWVGAFRTTFSF